MSDTSKRDAVMAHRYKLTDSNYDELWISNKDHEAIVADLRARLELFRGYVCGSCGCTSRDEDCGYHAECSDCNAAYRAKDYGFDRDHIEDCDIAACVSVGMRALCGRRVFP